MICNFTTKNIFVVLFFRPIILLHRSLKCSTMFLSYFMRGTYFCAGSYYLT